MGLLDNLDLGSVAGLAGGGLLGYAGGNLLGSVLGGGGSQNVNSLSGLGFLPENAFTGFLQGTGGQGFSQGARQQGQNITDILNQQGRTAPDLFNRILAGSSRGTESAQAGLRRRGARSGLDSGIQEALAAAIDLEGADRETGIRAQEAALAEDRKRSDVGLANAALIDPILAALGLQTGVATTRANIQSQQGNQGLQAIATLIGGLSNLRS